MELEFYKVGTSEKKIVEFDPWAQIEKNLTDDQVIIDLKNEPEWQKRCILGFRDDQGSVWLPCDERIVMHIGRWACNYVIVHFAIKGEIDEWRVYLVDLEGYGLPLRITGVCGDASFDEATGAIEIAVANGPNGSRHYIFRPRHEGWPEAYLEGWTEVRYLRDRMGSLFARCQRLSEEKKSLEEAIAEALEGLDQLIGQVNVSAIKNPLAALLSCGESPIQHCAEEIRAKLEAVRARLQSVTAELSS